MTKQKKYIISGGGTGGHIFPAIAIANALQKREPKAEILFIGAKGKMEMEKVPAAGYKIKTLNIQGLQRKLTLKNLVFPFKLLASLSKARKIVKEFKPDVVIGVGGYASGPTLRVATKKGIPTLIQEQNSYPGITNKILAARVNTICVAYPEMEKFFPKEKIVLTGNPIRKEIVESSIQKQEAIDFFNLKKDKAVVLIIGGSLGARTLNESVISKIKEIQDCGIQIIWQCGKYYYEELKEKAKDKEGILLKAFITRMDMAYAAADVVVSRAGALSISELSALGKATVFVPSPNVAEDHQTKNAKVLVNNNAALLVEDKNAREELIKEVLQLIKDKEKIKELEVNAKKMAYLNSAEKIADEIEKLENGRA
jgi:UDP-N-acetylglucosamine--N-acetylmuramyl-(pentapeptide) pyrophosphoryl-undecaprenol N-acetylglucosamine transferase